MSLFPGFSEKGIVITPDDVESILGEDPRWEDTLHIRQLGFGAPSEKAVRGFFKDRHDELPSQERADEPFTPGAYLYSSDHDDGSAFVVFDASTGSPLGFFTLKSTILTAHERRSDRCAGVIPWSDTDDLHHLIRLEAIYVIPEMREEGIGLSMIAAAMETARLAVEHMAIRCSEENFSPPILNIDADPVTEGGEALVCRFYRIKDMFKDKENLEISM